MNLAISCHALMLLFIFGSFILHGAGEQPDRSPTNVLNSPGPKNRMLYMIFMCGVKSHLNWF